MPAALARLPQVIKPISNALPFYDAAAVRHSLPWQSLIAALERAFAGGFGTPGRHIHHLPMPDGPRAALLLMPAWIEGKVYGVKLANVFPSNGALGLPTLHAVYLLFSARTGEPQAIMDGNEITVRRTVATSALASSFLSRTESRKLLVVGAGRLSAPAVSAHASVRAIDEVAIWARDPAKASAAADRAAADTGLRVEATTQLELAAREADIICCATLSAEPLIKGEWLKPGAHIDLIGAFQPHMRETDDEAVRRACVFIDTWSGAKAEAGDLIQAAESGAFGWDKVYCDLAALCKGEMRRPDDRSAITMFKSVGASIEDLVAAHLVFRAGDQSGRA